MTKLSQKELDHITNIISKEGKSSCHKAAVKIEGYLLRKGRLSDEDEEVSMEEKLKYVKRMLNLFAGYHPEIAKRSNANFHTVKRIHRLDNPATGDDNINNLYRYFKNMNK